MAHGSSNAAQALDVGASIPDREPLLEGDPARAALADETGLARPRRLPLTPSEEIALARRIEAGKRRLVQALAGSTAALAEIAEMASELKAHAAEPFDLTTTALAGDEETARFASAVEAAIRRTTGAVPGGRPGRGHGARSKKAARDDVAALLGEYGLSHKAIDRVLGKLGSLRAQRRGGAATQLDRESERILRAHREVDAATAAFVEANMGLVYWMATKRGRALLPLSDLVQEGTLGLMRAVEKFDYRRGVRFNTYAAWWIRHAINRALSDQARTIRVPVHLLETRHKLSRIARELAHEQGREPSAAELSNRTGILPETIRAVASIPAEPVSMDAPLNADGDLRLGDVIADPHGESIVDGISARQIGDRVQHLLATLTEREREVLSLRFGVRGSECLTFEQIGRKLSLSRERVRQIEAAALAKLRPQAAAECLDAHLSG
ncbi:MAG TPA: sigma-70 family RNA polymerase sigma factor [Polyangiaceae bacterium]|nr:sigma-70 family RNA polymerase sigma factor [Polyangiaceae bacterium]